MLDEILETLPEFKGEHQNQERTNKKPLDKAEYFRNSGWRFVARHPVASKQRTAFNFFVREQPQTKRSGYELLLSRGYCDVSVRISGDFVPKAVFKWI
jgi:hypothetical protein